MSHVGEVIKLPLVHQKSFITRTAWHKRSLPEAPRLVFWGDRWASWKTLEKQVTNISSTSILSLSFPAFFLATRNLLAPWTCTCDASTESSWLSLWKQMPWSTYILESNRLTHNFQRIHSWRWRFHAKLVSRFRLQGDEPAMLAAFPKLEFNRVPEFPEKNDRMHWQDHKSHESWRSSASCIFVPVVSITKKRYVLITLSLLPTLVGNKKLHLFW